ncbi:MAG: glycosyltransferase family 4 protein [Gloeobacteraceae cyanobacterium ES-bin-144]|nr:glycosyltransferase family 4 protein [Verrucomicrobiales bacterium]
MNLLFLQRLDQAGGGSRASLRTTLCALRDQRPDWKLNLVTQNVGPLSQCVTQLGVFQFAAAMPHYRNHLQRLSFWWACRRLAIKAEAFQLDGVLSNEWVTAPHAYQIARRLAVPAMSYVRDFAAIRRGRKYQLHRMDRLLCVCESMRQALIGVGYDPEKVRTVYNPVLRPVSRMPDPEILVRIQRQPQVDRWLLYLGRISTRKNQIAAIETLQHLREITGQRWGLLLVGDDDPQYAAEVDRTVKAAGLDREVLRLGMIAEPGWLFDLADASVLTSKGEGLARVLIESFLCGKPGFSYPVSGLEDIYGYDQDVFVSNKPDPLELANKIASGLECGETLRDRIQSLRLMLETRHSLVNHVAAFEDAVTS